MMQLELDGMEYTLILESLRESQESYVEAWEKGSPFPFISAAFLERVVYLEKFIDKIRREE